jgi:hypothetical protein
MIVKSHRLKLKTTEVPVRFLKDQKGRVSHLKRSGWLTPWRAGWHTLKIILVYGSDRVIVPISMTLSIPALIGLLFLSAGPVQIFGVTLTTHAMMFASTSLILGLVLAGISILSICINDRVGTHIDYWSARFQFTSSMIIWLSVFAMGFFLCSLFIFGFVAAGFVFNNNTILLSHLSILGMTMIILSFLGAGFTILIQALVDRIRVSERR